jgi:predicted phosphodiesterase
MRRNRKRSREIMLWGISALVVLSMLCSLVAVLNPSPKAPAATATKQPTSVVTVTPTMVPVTPTPSPGPNGTATPLAGSPPATPLAMLGTATPPQAALPVLRVLSQETDFTFDVVGDSGNSAALFTQVLAKVTTDHPAFLVHTGDVVANGNVYDWQDWKPLLAGFKVPFYSVPGNHDSADSTLKLYLEYTGVPGEHYALECGQAHLAFVDSHLGQVSADELAWLSQDLAATSQPLKIVVVHHPPFDPLGGDHVMAQGSDAFMTLMAERDVRYVFTGHIHAYRTAQRDGVTYVITGGAGSPLDGDAAQGGYHHYLRVAVHGAELSWEVVKLD